MKTLDVVFTWGDEKLKTLEMTPRQYQEMLIDLGKFIQKQELLKKCKKCATAPN
jgi:hypothetical protein